MDRFHSLLNADESEDRGKRIASFLMRLSPERSLDVGCSSGFLVQSLRGLGVEAYGLDSQGSRFLEPAKQFLSGVDAGIDAFPFSESTFDLVTALTSLDYVHNFSHALDEIARVSSKNGYFVLTFGTDPRLQFEARPNIFKKERWVDELFERGFSCEAKLTEDYTYEVGIRPQIENTLARNVPRTILESWRRIRGSAFDCVIARHILPSGAAN